MADVKKLITPVKVGIFVVAAGVTFGIYLQLLSSGGFERGGTYRVNAYFKDVLGLEKKSPVQIAGIDVGAIDEVVLEDGKAKITRKISDEIGLFEDAMIEKVAVSLLGDYKLSLTPGSPDKRRLKDGDWIVNVRSETSTEQIIAEVRKMAESLNRLVSGTPENPAPLEMI